MPRYFDFAAVRDAASLPRMIHDVGAAETLAAFLRRHPVDVAHLHNVYHHLTPSILPVLARRGVGVVMTVHDYRLACPTRHLLRRDGVCTRCVSGRFHHAAGARCAGLAGAALAVETAVQRLARRYFRPVAFFLCPSRFARDVLRRAGAPASKLVLLPNVLDLPAAPAEGAGRRELLYAGRISPEKAPEMMLDLAAAAGDAEVTVCGEGPGLPALRAEAGRRRLHNVRFEGQLAPEDLARRCARAAAVVLTSRWVENSPMAMLEAMAMGRCVIVPDHPPLREWVRDGRTGRTFHPGDAADLARVAQEVLDDAPARTAMGQAARRLVRRRHDPARLMPRLEGLYEEAIRRCAWRC